MHYNITIRHYFQCSEIKIFGYMCYLLAFFIYASMCKCVFFIGGNQIENVDSFSYLGHIIDSRFTDDRDILFRRNSFATKANNVLFLGN